MWPMTNLQNLPSNCINNDNKNVMIIGKRFDANKTPLAPKKLYDLGFALKVLENFKILL